MTPILYLVIPCYNEEQVLEQGLAGYAAYRKKVRWRLLPFIW
jgi:protein-S-isoprenylcysteine O-methyltransferase Ste14